MNLCCFGDSEIFYAYLSNLVEFQIGKVGLAGYRITQSAVNEGELAAAISTIICFSYEGSIDVQFKISAIGNNEECVLLICWQDGAVIGFFDEIIIVRASSTTSIMATEEEVTLVVDLKPVALVSAEAKKHTCMSA